MPPRKQDRPRQVRRARRTRPKLDPRLAHVLSLPRDQLERLKAAENEALLRTAAEIDEVRAALRPEGESEPNQSLLDRLRELEDSLFAPITSGVYFPHEGDQVAPAKIREPFISAFVLSDASAQGLANLGVEVRSQAGDLFTAFIPLAAIEQLEASPAVRFIELARPLFRTLDFTLPFTQIATLHNGMPAVTGVGVIVGVVDNDIFDFYHPDFRTAADATRVLYLWDQRLSPIVGEASPPAIPPEFIPTGGMSYGVEYSQATIDIELAHPLAVPAYQTVRHEPPAPPITVPDAHGTVVAGCAAGNGRGQAAFVGAAPGADIIFVRNGAAVPTEPLADNTSALDGFAYIFARAALLGRPCVVNMCQSDNQGGHDGTTLGEQNLDRLLLTAGRAITLSAGNSNNTASHAANTVPAGGTTNLVLRYLAAADKSDDVEIWYDRQDRLSVQVTVPTAPVTTIGPIAPGFTAAPVTVAPGVDVQVTSVLHDPRNGDNLISIIITLGPGATVPTGDWTIALGGTTVINGAVQAWVDRNNRGKSRWLAPSRQEGTLTLGVPSTARRAITVGAHDKTQPTPTIYTRSGRGPTRDGRVKPEIATVGMSLNAPLARNMNFPLAGQPLYTGGAIDATGTSFSAPVVAGACALLFECRGPTATWASLKQILEDTAGTTGLAPAPPNKAFGFGFLQMGAACARPPLNVDVWLKDDPADLGAEPFTGPVAWLSPDIAVLDTLGNPVPNPTHHPTNRFNNNIRVTVRNRGTQTARNTEVYLYWADPATYIPYPSAWNTSGIFTGGPAFLTGGNHIVIPVLPAGGFTTVDFAWAPPAPGSNIRGDDHFCLLVRLENEADPSLIGTGGWSVITSRNNVALRNVHVQTVALGGTAAMGFYVVGSSDQESLEVYPELMGGRVELKLPVQALPWRDLNVIGKLRTRRQAYGARDGQDPLAGLELTLNGDDARVRTDILGAARLELRDGVATVLGDGKGPLFLPDVRVLEGARMPARIRVARARFDQERCRVHVAQRSGGQLVGGVTLELRPRAR